MRRESAEFRRVSAGVAARLRRLRQSRQLSQEQSAANKVATKVQASAVAAGGDADRQRQDEGGLETGGPQLDLRQKIPDLLASRGALGVEIRPGQGM